MNTATRIMGAVLVIFATTAYGYILSRDLRARYNELKELKKIMFILKGEIGFGHTPVKEAFGNIALRCSEPLRTILQDFSSIRNQNEPVAKQWEHCMGEGLKKTHLSAAEKERLILLGDMLGLSDCDTQLHAIDVYLDELAVSIDQLTAALPGKVRLYNSLGVMCGIVIALIII